MAQITLRIIDGADRGKVFDSLSTPVTIGREEGNSIQLNDERVSRFHLKIQEDQSKLVLTDLESTNGTKVNGEDVQLRILRFGDRIAVGRSVLWFGTREQIAGRLRATHSGDASRTMGGAEAERAMSAAAFDFELGRPNHDDPDAPLHVLAVPELPERLSPSQAAQLAELLEYFHVRLRTLLDSVVMDEKTEQVVIDGVHWQSLVDLQAHLAEYLRSVSDPGM
jgi:hypothetical protein